MDFRQIVNFKQVRQEANLLYRAFEPLLAIDPKLADLVLLDLAKIVQICARSNQEISSSELLAYLMMYALLRQDKKALNVALNSWDFSDGDRLQYQKFTLQTILERTKLQPADALELPTLLNQLDKERHTHYATDITNAIYKFAQVLVKSDGTITMQEMEALSGVWQLLHTYTPIDSYQDGLAKALTKVVNPTPIAPPASDGASSTGASLVGSTAGPAAAAAEPPPPSDEDLSHILAEALAELDELVGMENIKEEVRTLTNLLKVQKIRADRGLAKTQVSLHSVFCGPPGTGKTTVGRLISRIYKGLGFLKKGHLIETDRSGMVAGYIGQTAKRVDELVESALDGVLLIDEAYALVPRDGGRDFGQEAVDILLKRMEDHRDRLVVIVAGYTDEMTHFIDSNPGLKSRFNRYFYFNDYTPEELLGIFEILCKKSHFHLTSDAKSRLTHLFEELYMVRDRTFGNGRLVRNLFEKTIEKQANRLAVLSSLTDDILTTLEADDIPVESKATASGKVDWQSLATRQPTAEESPPTPPSKPDDGE
ncbi:MAG: AAA family ATPase [Kaiparowitsia implicata GSE-PSE-MK54-09C]|nr:AAA family ATPase [Kaiparowitsia implicata GSE-PSE-MK54-09C]